MSIPREEIVRINEALRPRMLELAERFLPQGRLEGNEWCTGSFLGEPGNSCRVRINGANSGVGSDFATSGKGCSDPIGFIQQATGCTFPEAIEEGQRLMGEPIATSQAHQTRAAKSYKDRTPEERRESWPRFREGIADELKQLSDLRAIPFTGIQAAHSYGTLRFCNYEGHVCWLLRSHDGTCAEVRRLDGGKLKIGGMLVKAKALPGSKKKNCLLGEHLLGEDRDPCYLVEGGPDWLAACHLAYEALGDSQSRFWIPLGLLGANSCFSQRQLPLMADRFVRIFAHTNDHGVGLKAAKGWREQLMAVGCEVQTIYMGGLNIGERPIVKADGSAIEDLNDVFLSDPGSVSEFIKEATK